MKTTRRTFFLGGAALAALPSFSITSPAAGRKLRLGLIGCGGRMKALLTNAIDEEIVAMADPDPAAFEKHFKLLKAYGHGDAVPRIKLFSDYHDMLDKISGELDAVLIATTNHHHAPAAILAMSKGLHVYVEKPMASTIEEATAMRDAARKYGVATQVGNQGHSDEGVRRFAEYLAAGALGEVKDVWCWTDRVNAYAVEPPVAPIPHGFNWKAYLGDAKGIDAYRETMHPHGWHAWHGLGNGSIGNMATHIFDPFMWGMELGAPKSVELVECIPGGKGSWDVSSEFRWEFPANAKRGPVTIHWFDGIKPGIPVDEAHVKMNDCVRDLKWANRPPVVVEAEKKYGVDFGRSGGAVVCDKGVMRIGSGSGLVFAPSSFQKELGAVPKMFPREKHMTHMKDFFTAARGGRPAVCNFDYSEPLARIVLSGNLASLSGKGKKIAL